MNLFQTRAKAVKTLKTAVNPAGKKLTEIRYIYSFGNSTQS